MPLVLGESIEMRAEARYYGGGGLDGAAIAWDAEAARGLVPACGLRRVRLHAGVAARQIDSPRLMPARGSAPARRRDRPRDRRAARSARRACSKSMRPSPMSIADDPRELARDRGASRELLRRVAHATGVVRHRRGGRGRSRQPRSRRRADRHRVHRHERERALSRRRARQGHAALQGDEREDAGDLHDPHREPRPGVRGDGAHQRRARPSEYRVVHDAAMGWSRRAHAARRDCGQAALSRRRRREADDLLRCRAEPCGRVVRAPGPGRAAHGEAREVGDDDRRADRGVVSRGRSRRRRSLRDAARDAPASGEQGSAARARRGRGRSRDRQARRRARRHGHAESTGGRARRASDVRRRRSRAMASRSPVPRSR